MGAALCSCFISKKVSAATVRAVILTSSKDAGTKVFLALIKATGFVGYTVMKSESVRRGGGHPRPTICAYIKKQTRIQEYPSDFVNASP